MRAHFIGRGRISQLNDTLPFFDNCLMMAAPML
jgi:hypothetical protein